MPLQTAAIGDTVTYRNAVGETFNALVLQTEPAAPAGGAWSVANSGTGGTLGAATYSYRIAKVQNGLVGVAATAKTTVVGGGTTNKCTITLPTDVGVGGVSYNIYGRTGGSELLIASAITTATYDDTGAITPSGALPAATNGRVQLFNPTNGVPSTAAGVVKATALRGAGSTGVYMKR